MPDPPNITGEAWARAQSNMNHVQSNIRERKTRYSAGDLSWFYETYGNHLLQEAEWIQDEIRRWKSEHQLPVLPTKQPNSSIDLFGAAEHVFDDVFMEIRKTEADLSKKAKSAIHASFQRRAKYWVISSLREMRRFEERHDMRRGRRGKGRDPPQHRARRRVSSRDREKQPTNWFQRLAAFEKVVIDELRLQQHSPLDTGRIGNDAAYRNEKAIIVAGLINLYRLWADHKKEKEGNKRRGQDEKAEAEERRRARGDEPHRRGKRPKPRSSSTPRAAQGRSRDRREEMEREEDRAYRARFGGRRNRRSWSRQYNRETSDARKGLKGRGLGYGPENISPDRRSRPSTTHSRRLVRSRESISALSARPSSQNGRRPNPATSTHPSKAGSAPEYYDASASYIDPHKARERQYQSCDPSPALTESSRRSTAQNSRSGLSRVSSLSTERTVKPVRERSQSRSQDDDSEGGTKRRHSSRRFSRSGSVASFETRTLSENGEGNEKGGAADVEEPDSEVDETKGHGK